MAQKSKSKEVERIQEALTGMASERSCDLLIYSGPIDYAGFRKVVKSLPAPEKRAARIHMVLATMGGDPHAAYRISRLLSSLYKDFTIQIHGFCKSAGTLITIGATEIVMSDTAELGPLDAQVRKDDELIERSSGLDLAQAVDFLTDKALDAFRSSLLDVHVNGRLSTRLASEIAREIATGLFAPIFSQIDPLRVGELQRAIAIAHHYGTRLAGENLHRGALDRLVVGYPSHGFVIDRKEAAEIFKNIREPTVTEARLVTEFGPLSDEPASQLIVAVFPLATMVKSDAAEATPPAVPSPAPAGHGQVGTQTTNGTDAPPHVGNGKRAPPKAPRRKRKVDGPAAATE